jgi:2-keto-4-pentenoate hydratase/2-oxohepta-3-ene-1,7-dioic acid hydratase in catechol pathway
MEKNIQTGRVFTTLNDLATKWERNLEQLEAREKELKAKDDQLTCLAVSMVADNTLEHIIALRKAITDLQRLENHEKTMTNKLLETMLNQANPINFKKPKKDDN